MAKPAKQPDNSGLVGCGVIGGIILLIALIGQCSRDTGSSSVTDSMNVSNAEMSNAIAAQTPPPVQPLNAASVSRGVSHLRLAVSAEGFSGAMVYSQNCYDSLAREFTWAKLDQCGGSDMLAARSIESADTSALSGERAYFQSEAAAGRYLAAASGAGQPAPDVDARLNQLQRRVARERVVGRRTESANDDTSSNIGETVNDALAEPMDEVVGE